MSSKHRASHPKHAGEHSPYQPGTFAQNYPHIAKWVRGYGWIEWGDDLFPLERRSCIRALDEGGLIWVHCTFAALRGVTEPRPMRAALLWCRFSKSS
jgi:hypothetical protein